MLRVSSQAFEIDNLLATCSPFNVRAALCGGGARLATLAPEPPQRHLAGVEDHGKIEWRVSDGLVDYAEALTFMETRAAAIRAGEAAECVWLLEHPPLFTAGTSADPAELFNPSGFPVHEAGRGGRYTYHGPGQRVGYLMLDLERRGRDVRRLVHSLEGWIIATLAELGVAAHRANGRIGIWVGDGPEEAKIAALGIRIKRWVTLHGFAINVSPDLSHFGGIVPCGISEFGVTSLEALGKETPMMRVDMALKRGFPGFLKDLSQSCKVA
ncbi:MAG: lipoyl(octanoyl) transferase LipB [Sphingomonas sp.]|nr:lipoyl(octanoyl) transferase LipB [Sphingomonas sp.]